jgi:hypothetical protein
MTLQASGPISLANVNTELQLSSTATISLNDTLVRTLFGASSGAISMSNGYGKAYTIPGNSGILTSGSSFTLPSTSGLTINVLVIGGGGGGGGGSNRRTNAGYNTGGGGGGSGGNAYVLNIPVVPGQTVTFTIGGGGSNGGTRDGIYTSGSNGGSGGSTIFYVNGVQKAAVSGGGGGLVSPSGTPGSGGSVSTGTQILSSITGGTASANTIGGLGAKGYTINTGITVPSSSLGYGSTGTAGAHGTGIPCVSGTIYGAGGTGGGTAQGDAENNANVSATSGTSGALVIWWGY